MKKSLLFLFCYCSFHAHFTSAVSQPQRASRVYASIQGSYASTLPYQFLEPERAPYLPSPQVALSFIKISRIKKRIGAAFLNTGNLYVESGNPDSATHYFKAAIVIFEELHDKQPANFRIKQKLVDAYTALGSVFLIQKKMAPALTSYLQASHLLEEMDRQHAPRISTKQSLSRVYAQLFEANSLLGNTSAAFEISIKSCLVLASLSQLDVENERHQIDLANTYSQLGSMYFEQNKLEEALDYFNLSKNILQPFYLRDSSNLEVKSGLTITYFYTGHIALVIQKNEAAKSFLSDAEKLLIELSTEAPEMEDFKLMLRHVQTSIARLN